jgi:hypothetical protein
MESLYTFPRRLFWRRWQTKFFYLVRELSDTHCTIINYALLQLIMVKRWHIFPSFYKNSWKWCPPAFKYPIQHVNKFCNTFWSSSSEDKVIMQISCHSIDLKKIPWKVKCLIYRVFHDFRA